MSESPDARLFLLIDEAIEITLATARFGEYNAGFVSEAEELDSRLYDSRNIPHRESRELWHYADEYFDSFVHGFPDFHNMPWPVARLELESHRAALRIEFGISPARNL
jgi:hypothetical protein